MKLQGKSNANVGRGTQRYASNTLAFVACAACLPRSNTTHSTSPTLGTGPNATESGCFDPS